MLNVNPRTKKTLSKLGIQTEADLLFHFPRKHLDFSKTAKIKDLKLKEIATIKAKVISIKRILSFKTKRYSTEAVVADDSGLLTVTWYNQGYITQIYKAGQEIVLSGRLEYFRKPLLVNPAHEALTEETLHTGRLVPVYKLTEGVYDKTFRKIVKDFLPLAKDLEDTLPNNLLNKLSLPSLQQAITNWHFPEDEGMLYRAKYRFAFEEALIQQLAANIHLKNSLTTPAPVIPANVDLVKKGLSSLPFELTVGQKKSLWQIMQDINKPTPMNRLLEGDVGSGKTLISLFAMGLCANTHFQSALLAPTEILANQHYETALKFFGENKKILKKVPKIILLTGQLAKIDGEKVSKKTVLESLLKDKSAIVLGTHALLYKKEYFNNLGLVIIDEQHRFGVAQRSSLKELSGVSSPHLLSMSATPIPRTLALTLYSNLSISLLEEIPKSRIPISTHLISENKRQDAYKFIKDEIKKGHQAYILIPVIEESEDQELGQKKSLLKEFEFLSKKIFPELKLGILHGKMSGQKKTEALEDFQNHKTDILVSTSVIEIGVDTPNATVMMIEDAEKFGLAQLHQLRGRVGRGTHKSYCLLFTNTENEDSLERLKVFMQTNNGFKLAEIDLETRGFGDLFGVTQSGFNFKYSQYMTLNTLKLARKIAEEISAEPNAEIKYKALYEKAAPLSEKIHLE